MARPCHAVPDGGRTGAGGGRTTTCRPAEEGAKRVRPTKGHAAQGPRGRGRGRRQRARVPAAGRLPQTVPWVRAAASCEAAASLGPRRLFSVELSEEAWDEMANWAFVSRKQRGSDRGWGRAAKGSGVLSRPLSTSLLTPKCGAGANPANRGSRRLLRPRPPRVTSSSTGDRRATLRALSVDCSFPAVGKRLYL